MGNKTKIALSSAFACTMALGLIGCNKNTEPSIPEELSVNFTSDKFVLETSVTKVKKSDNLSLKIKLPAEAKGKGYRLPKPSVATEKDLVRVTTGNRTLSLESEFGYTIDQNKEAATLTVGKDFYSGTDVSVTVNAVNVVSFGDEAKLVVNSYGNTGDQTTVVIESPARGYMAPERLSEVKVDGAAVSESDFDYFAPSNDKTGTLIVKHKEGVIPDSIVISGVAQADPTSTIQVTFHGDEVGWGKEGSEFKNRTYLADIDFAGGVSKKNLVGEENISVIQTVERSDLKATISINDWTGYVGELPMKSYKKDFNYSHELSDARDVEGILKDFIVVGNRMVGDKPVQEVIKSSLYTFNISDHNRVGTFEIDKYVYENYASLEITCNVKQVANNVFVNFGDLNSNLKFDRHCYRYDSKELGEDNFKGNIVLDAADERRLPRDGDNSRVEVALTECGNDDEHKHYEVLDTTQFDYKISDGDNRHEAAIEIHRNAVPFADDKTQYDILITIKLVDTYEVEFIGDYEHLYFTADGEKHYQDDDLNAHIDLIQDTERAKKYDYAETFRVPTDINEHGGLIHVWGSDEAGEKTEINDYTYTLKSPTSADIKVPQAQIAQYKKITIAASAVRTHYLATLTEDSSEFIDFEYTDTQPKAEKADGILIPVPEENVDKIEIGFKVTAAGIAANKKMVGRSDNIKIDPTGPTQVLKRYGRSVKDVGYDYHYNSDVKYFDKQDTWTDGDPIKLEVNSTTGHIKDHGTLTVNKPLNTIDASYAKYHIYWDLLDDYNEDVLISITTRDASLTHKFVVTDGDNPMFGGKHYQLKSGSPTEWTEGENHAEVTLVVEFKDKTQDDPSKTDPTIKTWDEFFMDEQAATTKDGYQNAMDVAKLINPLALAWTYNSTDKEWTITFPAKSLDVLEGDIWLDFYAPGGGQPTNVK